MSLPLDSLAIEQLSQFLDSETKARTTLSEAVTAFHKKELTKSANLFLKSWRILQNEYECTLYKRLDSLQEQREMAQANNGIMFLSLIALHDLAKACSHNAEKYKDDTGNCVLDIYLPQDGWLGNTTVNELEIDDNVWPEDSGIAHMLLLKDTLGRFLDYADSFQEAANIISHICSLRVASFLDILENRLYSYKLISDKLLLISILTSGKIASTESKTYEMEEGGNKEISNKLAIKIKEAKNKKCPLTKEEEKDLIHLFDSSISPKTYKGEKTIRLWAAIDAANMKREREAEEKKAQEKRDTQKAWDAISAANMKREKEIEGKKEQEA